MEDSVRQSGFFDANSESAFDLISLPLENFVLQPGSNDVLVTMVPQYEGTFCTDTFWVIIGGLVRYCVLYICAQYILNLCNIVVESL